MTLEELKSKVVNIRVNKDIVIGEDLEEDELKDLLEEQSDLGISDKEFLEMLLDDYYRCIDLVDPSECTLTIH